MKKSIIWLWVALIVCFVVSFGSVSYAADSMFAQKGGDDSLQQFDLKRQCLTATITAINSEIERHQRWIDLRKQQGEQEALPALQEKLTALKADLEKFSAMDAKDYILPEKVTAVAWVEGEPRESSILYVENMTRSGPWYHLAGIAGGDYAVLPQRTKLRLGFYPVYPRSYGGMYSEYVYIAEGFDGYDSGKSTEVIQSPGKRILGEVFAPKYTIPYTDKVKCENYQVYLLKDTAVGSKGKLVLDSKKSSFDFTLPAEVLDQYSYLEFVSAYGTRTIKLAEIKDKALEIVLEPEVIVKKPAIYLYPVQKSQIVVLHKFKGKILNTYPTYTDNWTVIADPSGNLLNVKDNRYYKYLFWDGAYTFPEGHYQYKAGFYVANKDYVSFLQSKLAGIGLNENEINDFIVYWLPVMNKYKNCFVHFRINDSIDGSSILETKPKPDTVIRVFMEFTGIDNLSGITKLPEQTLPSFTRKGFTLVEWGGAEFGKGKLE